MSFLEPLDIVINLNQNISEEALKATQASDEMAKSLDGMQKEVERLNKVIVDMSAALAEQRKVVESGGDEMAEYAKKVEASQAALEKAEKELAIYQATAEQMNKAVQEGADVTEVLNEAREGLADTEGALIDSAKELVNKGFYNILDKDIPGDLDFSKLIIEGETMTVIFQTGQLAGKEFDVKYIHSTRKFELVPINENGLIYPQGVLIPVVGDQYAVFHMTMPEQYITLAEEEALQDVVKYLWENEQSQYSYRWQLDGNYAKRNWGEIRGFLNCGFFVKFSDPQFLPEPVAVRIVAVKELVNDDKRPEITIANTISSKSFGSIINKIPTQEQATERKDKEVITSAKSEMKKIIVSNTKEAKKVLFSNGVNIYFKKFDYGCIVANDAIVRHGKIDCKCGESYAYDVTLKDDSFLRIGICKYCAE